MATRKLKVELDVDTAAAKRKVKEVVETGGDSAATPSVVTPAAAEAAREMKNTAKSTRELGDAAKSGAVNMGQMVKVFTGMGIHLATSYAASRLEDGSAAQKAVTYGGAIASGAMAGAAFGPWGAVAGGALAAGKTYLDQEAAEKAAAEAKQKELESNLKNVAVWEETRSRTQSFREELEKLTKSETELDAAIRRREEEDRRLAEVQRGAAGDAASFADATRLRQMNANELDALRGAKKTLSAHEDAPGFRSGIGATDALARIGGDFGGGAMPDLVRNAKDQLAVLKSIDSKTSKGGAAWQ